MSDFPSHLLHYIDGKLVPSASGEWLDVFNPAYGKVYSQLASGKRQEVDMAVEAAQKAKKSWGATSQDERCRLLNALADGIEKRFDEFAHAESIDNGKPLWLTKAMDIPRAIANLRFFGHAITQFSSEAHETVGQNAINYTLRQPIGVVACISPWNLPLYLFTWKIAPALAAGNSVIAKPSEITPLSAFLLSEVCIEAGLPPGVLNIIHGLGPDVGDAISRHPGIKAISFTGSTRVGKEIASIAAPMFKKLSLEMGGKNPILIFDDCNYDKMLHTVIRSSFVNQGQICLCGSRIFVQKGIYDKFKSDLISLSNQMEIGDPLLETSRIGAIVSKPHYEKILNHIEIAKKEGGQILCGGHAVFPKGFEDGWFIAPTIIERLSNQCVTNQEEIFGPVVTIASFETEEEVLKWANDSQYGLACSIWTENNSRVHRMAQEIESGIVWVNTWLLRDLRTPFGGVKNSGVGREGGFEALRFFTEAKNVCIQY
ncbi:MAG: aldehyde dehydrogenase [Saprospiraceae bacterium]|nr:aldehyde dehydrogenase [Saprospiraceae bacterium]